MEFNEKLQELRKRKNLTQEELAQALYVSRTAVSKWESGRGYPSIDSLKAVAAFFSVTIDELLSGEEALSVAEGARRQSEDRFRGLVFGLLDCAAGVLLFLPFFGQRAGDAVQAVSLLSLAQAAPYLRAGYLAAVLLTVLWGVLTLALQGCGHGIWVVWRCRASLLLSVAGVLLFIMGRQVYAAAFLFIFLAVKVLVLLKKP